MIPTSSNHQISQENHLAVASAISSTVLANDELEIIKPKKIKIGSTIGIFTPSWPAHILIREKYLHAISELQRLGFNVVEGSLTKQCVHSGYRSGTAKERANEFMELINNENIDCLIASIGGSNSSSMLPFLNYEQIRKAKKIVCGYSDITSLHLAILKKSKLSTIYGAALVPTFGEFPHLFEYSVHSFFQTAMNEESGFHSITPPLEWSRQFIDASQKGWREIRRKYIPNPGWEPVNLGSVTGKIVVANLETLLSLAGTEYFPDLRNRILFIEETVAEFSRTEKNYTHLKQMGVFNEIIGLVISKPGEVNSEGAPFSHLELIKEIIGNFNYPAVYNFDCGHTFPMISLPEGGNACLNISNESVNILVDNGLE